MVIGEGPGGDEDRAGRPFVGRAGQLLDKMLASVGLSRNKNCFIANMVKCRPPGNRDPALDEIAACFPYLERQINILRPKVILAAGRVAAQSLLRTSRGINALRGGFSEFELAVSGKTEAAEAAVVSLLPTFHPSAILRDESLKRPAWEDLKLLRSRLNSFDME
jgi:DNA polymerase